MPGKRDSHSTVGLFFQVLELHTIINFNICPARILYTFSTIDFGTQIHFRNLCTMFLVSRKSN